VRAAITIGQNPGGWTAYVGDRHANVHALDAMTGKVLWTTHADDQPAARITGAPTLVGTTLFVPVSSTVARRGGADHRGSALDPAWSRRR